MGNELSSVIENSFDAISVLLVFVTVLYSIRYPEIRILLDEPLQTDRPKALERQKKVIRRDLIVKWIPVVALSFLVVYTSTPLALKVITHSRLDLLNFDFIRTSFVLIWYFNIGFFLSSILILVKLLHKLYLCKI